MDVDYVLEVGSPFTTPTNTTTPQVPPATASNTPATAGFSDVAPSDYFYEAVMYLAAHGVISGYGDGTFRPGSLATRGQIGKIVYNAVKNDE